MYFIIQKINNQFSRSVYLDSVPWDEIISKIKSFGTILELFQSSSLELKHFEEYFQTTYQKDRMHKHARKTR